MQLRPDRNAMAEDAQSRVQAAVKSFVNDVDRTHLRTLVKQHNTLTLLLNGHFEHEDLDSQNESRSRFFDMSRATLG